MDSSLARAYAKTYSIEMAAQVYFLSLQIGVPDILTEEQIHETVRTSRSPQPPTANFAPASAALLIRLLMIIPAPFQYCDDRLMCHHRISTALPWFPPRPVVRHYM